MNKTADRMLSKAIREKREQLVALRKEVEVLIEYVEILKARTRDKNEPRLTHQTVMKRYRVK